MAHYAFLDESNIVTQVIVGVDENELLDGKTPETWYSELTGQTCIRTSYNSKIRFNYAGIGYKYDPVDDAFIAPRPDCGHDSITLNTKKIWECAECIEIYG